MKLINPARNMPPNVRSIILKPSFMLPRRIAPLTLHIGGCAVKGHSPLLTVQRAPDFLMLCLKSAQEDREFDNLDVEIL